jgi:hypothetical protein
MLNLDQDRGSAGLANPALDIEADTGLWLRPVQYERIARAAGNARGEVSSIK